MSSQQYCEVSSLSRAGIRSCGTRQQKEAVQDYIKNSVLIKQYHYWIGSKPSLLLALQSCLNEATPPPQKNVIFCYNDLEIEEHWFKIFLTSLLLIMYPGKVVVHSGCIAYNHFSTKVSCFGKCFVEYFILTCMDYLDSALYNTVHFENFVFKFREVRYNKYIFI